MEIWVSGGYSGTSDLDLGRKVGNLGFGGVFWNFGFGLRKEEKLEIWVSGGVFWNFGFGLRKKSWKFGFGGVFWSDLDLGRKVGNLGFGGYSGTSDLDLGRKVGNLGFGGGILELRIWT